MNVEKMRRQVARAGPVDTGDPVQTFIEHVARIERQTRAQRPEIGAARDLDRAIQAFRDEAARAEREWQLRWDGTAKPPRKRSWLPW